MKTPEEIKRALELCSGAGDCEECPYYNNNDAECGHDKNREALAYIHYLEEGAEVMMGRVRELEADHRTEYCDNFFGECVELGKARKRIAELEARVAKDMNVPRWISVEERLPPKEG